MERGDMETLLLVPLDDTIVFPGMTATLALEVGDEDRVLLVPRTAGEFASVGTVAEVAEQMRIPGGTTAVTVQGLYRASPGPTRPAPCVSRSRRMRIRTRATSARACSRESTAQ
jgi:ATP-dependent Lon protease